MPVIHPSSMMKPVVRTCRYGHGHLELLFGSWALSGLKPRNPIDSLVNRPEGRTRGLDGRVFALRVWRCAECGYVELFDEDSTV